MAVMEEPPPSKPGEQPGAANEPVRPIERSVTAASASELSVDGEDVFGIQQLTQDYNRLIKAISNRIETLAQTASLSAQHVHQSVCDKELVAVDEAASQLRRVMKQCDELEVELLKIQQIGIIVEGFRERILALEKEFTI